MNQAEFEAHWKRKRDQITLQWDRLSEHDVDRVAGRYTHFVGLLQEKYGFTPAQASAEIDQWLQQPLARNWQPAAYSW